MEQPELTKEAAVKILNSRKLFQEPGKYQAQVTSVNLHTKEGEDPIYIVNLAAMNNFHLEKATKALREGDYQAAVNSNLSASQRPNKDYVPRKGEIVHVNLDYVKTKEHGPALLVVSLTEIPVANATNVNFSLIEEEETIAES